MTLFSKSTISITFTICWDTLSWPQNGQPLKLLFRPSYSLNSLSNLKICIFQSSSQRLGEHTNLLGDRIGIRAVKSASAFGHFADSSLHVVPLFTHHRLRDGRPKTTSSNTYVLRRSVRQPCNVRNNRHESVRVNRKILPRWNTNTIQLKPSRRSNRSFKYWHFN